MMVPKSRFAWSGSGNMACQSCHCRELGWTHGIALPANDAGVKNTRRSPSLYNMGHQSLWCWDGRATTLEGNVLAAWRNQLSVDPAKAAEKINAVLGY